MGWEDVPASFAAGRDARDRWEENKQFRKLRQQAIETGALGVAQKRHRSDRISSALGESSLDTSPYMVDPSGLSDPIQDRMRQSFSRLRGLFRRPKAAIPAAGFAAAPSYGADYDVGGTQGDDPSTGLEQTLIGDEPEGFADGTPDNALEMAKKRALEVVAQRNAKEAAYVQSIRDRQSAIDYNADAVQAQQFDTASDKRQPLAYGADWVNNARAAALARGQTPPFAGRQVAPAPAPTPAAPAAPGRSGAMVARQHNSDWVAPSNPGSTSAAVTALSKRTSGRSAAPTAAAAPVAAMVDITDVDQTDIPDFSRADWTKYRRALLNAMLEGGEGNPELVDDQVDAIIKQKQQEGFAHYARQGALLQQGGNNKGAMAAYKTAWHYLPSGTSMQFGVQGQHIVGFEVNEKTGKPIPNTVKAIDPETAMHLAEAAADPAKWGLYAKSMRDEERENQKVRTDSTYKDRAGWAAMINARSNQETDALRVELAAEKARGGAGAYVDSTAFRAAEAAFRKNLQEDESGIVDPADIPDIALLAAEIKQRYQGAISAERALAEAKRVASIGQLQAALEAADLPQAQRPKK
jgi:hypothetical protein